MLSKSLTENYFEEKRAPGVIMFFDLSSNKPGRQALKNRLLFMRQIKTPWNAKQLSDDAILVEMKKVFFNIKRDSFQN